MMPDSLMKNISKIHPAEKKMRLNTECSVDRLRQVTTWANSIDANIPKSIHQVIMNDALFASKS